MNANKSKQCIWTFSLFGIKVETTSVEKHNFRCYIV